MLFVTKEPIVKKHISEMEEEEPKKVMEMLEKFLWETGPKMLSFWEAAYNAVYVKLKEEKERMLMENLERLSLEDLTKSPLNIPASIKIENIQLVLKQ